MTIDPNYLENVIWPLRVETLNEWWSRDQISEDRNMRLKVFFTKSVWRLKLLNISEANFQNCSGDQKYPLRIFLSNLT